MKQFFCLFAALFCATACAHAQAGKFRYRWVYLSQNLQVDANVPKVEALLLRAKNAGYNGVMLSDYKFNILDRVPARYFANLARVKATADKLGMEIYPQVAPIGYSNGLLAHDPNLAEGLPVRDARFVVAANGETADVTPAPAALLPGGDFEATARSDVFAGWNFQDAPGTGTFVDKMVFHSGAASLRLENIGGANPPSGNGRVSRSVAVLPFRQYHLSAWIKTENFASANQIRCAILPQGATGGNGKSGLCYNEWRVPKTSGWTQYHAVFNSLTTQKIGVYVGVWGGTTGTLWLDDVRLEEVGLLNVLRRSGCPLTVQSDDGQITYTEGRDFAPAADPKLGVVPYAGNYDVYHAPPVLRVFPGGRIRVGQILRVSFFHSVTVYEDQVACCVSNADVDKLVAAQIADVEKALHSPGFFLGHDELRVAGWDNDCLAQKATPGKLLAQNAARCAEAVRRVSPNATVFFWSDMFDPFHNARDEYYLVNGTLAGSWEGLPKNAVIVNWNSGKPMESLPFFAKLGFQQILAGYYDHNPGAIKKWLDAGKNVPNIAGVMYTTWRGNYDDLEAFAQAAWGK